ncbi:Phosphatidate cytidylyltransferase [Ignavibacterium album JCM 16511]|uniref:Phosphatidate cytidylyltransferase n=1 Tax=Ignavibacterium album (strain DSM 19864 / JCM 16511 / NBRC 101810 / Mat9-16) TaxID=945713 RepID=I0AH77_IGNAJ|nr:phosphatidate cytidylyltransferase [Ignavibacterium album]AFH48334.1 Phosphatidate cytidylyltransferase [Ignavibacterium album JCM 16511]
MKLNNAIVRILVSVFAIPLILIVSYLGKWYFTSFILAIALIAFYEFYSFAKSKNALINLPFGLIGIALIIVNQFKPFNDYKTLIIFWFLILLIYELFRNKESALLNLSLTSFGFLYFALMGSSLIAIREFYPDVDDLYNKGAYIIFSLLGTIWICDSAAYFFGTAFGKHKLFPRVSPKKSWEGAIFGFVFAILSMILFQKIFVDFLPLSTAIGIGVIIGIFGQIGDLIESLLKRDAGVKDSSNLIPGHGGIFDRFDSLLFSAPFVYYYLFYFGR